GKTDSTFFTDRSKGELWVGPRLGVPETAARYGIHEARPLKDLPEMIRGLHDGGATRPWRILRGIDPMLDAQLPAQTERDKAFATALSEMRLLKDSLEIGELRKAIKSTQNGFEDVIRALPHSETERWVEGVFNLR